MQLLTFARLLAYLEQPYIATCKPENEQNNYREEVRAELPMATITYQVTLTTDGKPVVSVTSDDPQAARDAIPWLAQTYATLLKDAKAVPTPATTLTLPKT